MRSRPSWCRCSRKKVCEGHKHGATKLAQAFEAAEAERATGEHIDVSTISVPPAGVDAGYDYTRGGYRRGARPVISENDERPTAA